jgi:NitT/TauT family transport system permease protein
VALNKLPLVTVTVREGALPGSPIRRDGAGVPYGRAWTRLHHVIMPQLAPYIAAAAARACPGLENRTDRRVAGRSIGQLQIGVAFQLFDVTFILAYAWLSSPSCS